MVAAYYPFIDIAVHEKVRAHYAAGEALALFSTGLDQVLWANGAGATLFGFGSVYDFLEQGPDRRSVFFRQFEASANNIAGSAERRAFTVRIASGFQSRIVSAAVETITLPDGARACLFSAPTEAKDASPVMRARQMLAGLDDPDTHMAVLDDEGALIAASSGYTALGITPHTARTLVQFVAHDSSGLAKRSLPTERGYLPAAAARISANPALNLIFVIDNSAAHGTVEPAETVATVAIEDDVRAEADTQTVPEPTSDLPLEEPSFEQTVAEAAVALSVDVPPDAPAPLAPVAAVEAAPAPQEIAPTDAAGSSDFVFDPARRPFRFVWKTDAEGRFSEVSREFADAVGPHAADIRGQSFMSLAERYGFDLDHKIAEALARRDTWSGKTVLWPVEGTRLQVPVDLAALPAYNRAREFDGFRGFGIVRPGDAVVDQRGTGLGLTAASLPFAEPAAPQETGSPDITVTDDVTVEATQAFAEAAETLAAAPQVLEDAAEAAGLPQQDDFTPSSETATAEPIITGSGDDRAAAGDPAEDGNETTFDDNDASPEGVEATPSRALNDAAQWPEGEPPALKFTPNPGRRLSDKIISLEEHRARSIEGLTAGEQAAFREIGRKLEAFQQDDGTPDGDETDAAATPTEMTHTEDAPETGMAPSLAAQPDDTGLDSEAPAPEAAAPEEASTPEPQHFSAPRGLAGEGLNPDILAQMPVALLILSGDTLFHANPEFLRLTGYDDLEAVRAVGGLDALLQRDDLDGTQVAAGAVVLVKADDEVMPVTARLQSVRWEGASALMLALMPALGAAPAPTPAPAKPEVAPVAMVQDAAANETARLRVEVEEMRSILETATDGVVILGQNGEIRSMNRSASALFNYDEEETRGKPFVMLFAHESQKAVADYLNGLSDNGVMSVLNDGREVIGREASGGLLPLFMTIGKLSSSQRYCAVMRDITQWKRSEEELRNAKRAAETANAHKTDFLARVSHEIRTPLNAIIGFADLIASEHFAPVGHPRYIEYANDIGRSGRHVLDIVNDLLDISKIEAGEMDLDFAAVSLNESITEAVALVQPQANNQRVIIRTALSHAVPAVVADLRSIKQIVLNILANSIRFTPAGGQIVVSTAYEANGSVALRIRDTGIGMTRSELEQAMKPFRQVSTNQQKRGDGTGLGLPLTKAMTEANRASFIIQSAPNEGTLVEISFPPQRVLAN